MTDRVHPSSKPNNPPVTTINNPKLPLPPAKAHLHNQNIRNPIHHHRNRRRRCFCLYCFWLILIIFFIIILATISGTVLYLLYRPHRPEFSVTSLKTSKFNLTTASDGTTRLTANLNLTITTKNPNEKIEFRYDRFAIACVSVTDGTEIASGYFGNSFVSNPKNITILRTSLNSNSLLLETETVSRIRSDLKKKLGMKLKILLDTQAVIKVGSFKSKKVGIRIKCDGIRSGIPKSGGAGSNSSSSVSATISDAKCAVDLRIKIWKLSF